MEYKRPKGHRIFMIELSSLPVNEEDRGKKPYVGEVGWNKMKDHGIDGRKLCSFSVFALVSAKISSL